MTSCVCHISINSEASHRQPALINSLINFLLKEMHDYIGGGQCWLQDKLIWVFRAGRYPAHMSAKAQSHLEAGSDFTPREQQPCHLKLPLQPVSRENIYTRQKCILLLWFHKVSFYIQVCNDFCNALFWKFIWEVVFIFWLACPWDGGNPVFQVNQSAITSEQQLTAWGKKERSACGIYFVSTSTSPFWFLLSFSLCSVWLLIRDLLSSILTLYPCYSYTPHFPLIFFLF